MKREVLLGSMNLREPEYMVQTVNKPHIKSGLFQQKQQVAQRPLRWQRRGQEFDPPRLHHKIKHLPEIYEVRQGSMNLTGGIRHAQVVGDPVLSQVAKKRLESTIRLPTDSGFIV